MPRTKVKRSTVQKTKNNEDVNALLVLLETKRKLAMEFIEESYKTALEALKNKDCEMRMKIPSKYLNMAVSDVMKLTSFNSTTVSENVLSIATIVIEKGPKKAPGHKRSSSCVDDEGYLTTDSGSGTGARASRSRTKRITPNKRLTRSLSRMKTPISNQTPPNSYGLITPKVKPNTPLVILRRPKMGEMVLSVQGSPVLAAPPVETMANINIPMVDGTLLSLQAQAGLRKSQIPDLDPEVQRQLKMLREHLNLMLPSRGD